MENDFSFVAPEGVYTVTEEHKSTAPTQNQAGVNAVPCLYPTRVSSVLVRFPANKPTVPPPFAQLLGANKEVKKEKSPKEREDGISLSSSETPDDSTSSTPENTTSSALETHTPFAHPQPQNSVKKKSISRPRHNIKTSSSTFITRIQAAEGLSKTLQSKQGDATFIFYNMAKIFLWIEAGVKLKEPLSRITFSAYPTCHDVNMLTASPDQIDVIIGFATGDLIWLDPISFRYCRLNKQGCISNSPCTAVRWVPSSPTLFLVSHADGTIIAYDKEREDGTFVPQDPAPAVANGPAPDDSSSQEWDPTDSIVVTMPPWHPIMSGSNVPTTGKTEKEKAGKNPVSHWRVSRRKIVDFVFSPDVKYVGAISEDGCLRVIDAMSEQLVDCYASYFGALTCVAWSPDGRFILTGGQDDLLTIFSPWEQRVIARCQGHSSFVSAVAFDELRCDGRTYRFGSVGEDNKLILWDFSYGVLHRPKTQASYQQRTSASSTLSLAFRRDRSALFLPSAVPHDNASPRFHAAPSRNEIAIVQPVLVKQVESDLLAHIAFLPSSILTTTKIGHLKLWIRPLTPRSRILKNRSPTANASGMPDDLSLPSQLDCDSVTPSIYPPQPHPLPLSRRRAYTHLNAIRDLQREMDDLSEEENELEDINMHIHNRGFSFLIPIGRVLTQQEEKNDADEETEGTGSEQSDGGPSLMEDDGENDSNQDLDASMEDLDEEVTPDSEDNNDMPEEDLDDDSGSI